MSDHEQTGEFVNGIIEIAEQLEELRIGAQRLKDVYADAAITSDLTFIRIVEHSYERLVDEIEALAGLAQSVKTVLADEEEEATR